MLTHGRRWTVLAALLIVGLVVLADIAQAETITTKTSTESVANTTLQADDELAFTATAGAYYEIRLDLIYATASAASTPHLKWVLGEDTSIRGMLLVAHLSSGGSFTATAADTRTNAPNVSGATNTDRVAHITGTYGPAAGGTVTLQWAQNTAQAGNATQVKAGSVLRVRPLGEATGGGGSVAWADITGKPSEFPSAVDELLDVDLTGLGDNSILEYDSTDTRWEVGTDDEGAGGSGGLSADDRIRLDYIWWGVWALVGLALVGFLAPRWYRALDTRHGWSS